MSTGNTSFIGIEAENGGRKEDTWPDVQMDAYRRGAAALLKHAGVSSEMCCGHREFAPHRKIDPLFDMNAFRTEVDKVMRGVVDTRPLIPPTDFATGKPTLHRDDRGDDVRIVQRAVGADADGKYGPNTEAAVRRFQRENDLVPDGIVGPKTWSFILRPRVVEQKTG